MIHVLMRSVHADGSGHVARLTRSAPAGCVHVPQAPAEAVIALI